MTFAAGLSDDLAPLVLLGVLASIVAFVLGVAARRAGEHWPALWFPLAFGPAVLIIVLLVALDFMSFFLMSEPPPEPSVAPIEILANGSPACEPSEGQSWVAGTHDISVVAPERGHVRVILVDSAGRTVFDRHGNWMNSSTVTLAPGRYRLRCNYGDGSSGTSTMIVTSS